MSTLSGFIGIVLYYMVCFLLLGQKPMMEILVLAGFMLFTCAVSDFMTFMSGQRKQ